MVNPSYRDNLILGKDANGNVTYEIPFANIGYDTTLNANVAQSLTVPANVNTALFTFSSGTDVFVDGAATAGVPSGSFTASTGDLNPVMRPVYEGQVLSFISPTQAYIKVSFYTKGNI